MPIESVLILALFILLFGVALLVFSSLLGPRRTRDPVKLEPYECGIPGSEKKDTKVSVKFYLTAILFIIFDIEIIFLYPWALTYNDFLKEGYGLFILSSMLFFLLVFIFGLFWEVKSKALEWD